jgi:hypothetical protein
MAKLPLIDWSQEVIAQRLSFLQRAARFEPPLADDAERTPTGREPSREVVTDVHALLAAVDMAFATNRTELGLKMLNDAVETIVERGDLQIAALPGSIVGTVTTIITVVDSRDEGPWSSGQIDISHPVRKASEAFPPPSPRTFNLLSDLLIASLVGADPVDRSSGFFDRWPIKVIGLGEPLLQAFAAFDNEDYWPTAKIGLAANTALWIERLGRCRRDEFHWQQGRVRGALIDFRRVAFEIALISRADGKRFREWQESQDSHEHLGLAGQIDLFVGQLAREIIQKGRQ